MRTAIALCLLLVGPWAAAQTARSTAPPVAQRVDSLVQQLGSETYVDRRLAQRELQQMGLAAFDGLYAARDNRDPEIAVTAQRLLSQMAVHWTQPGDAPAVRDLLEEYGHADELQRAEAISELSRLPDLQGAAALCRIARFDLSPRIASRAAVAVMTVLPTALDATPETLPRETPAPLRDRIRQDLAELADRYGPSARKPAHWLERFATPEQDAQRQLQYWRGELADLRGQQQYGAAEMEPLAILALEWNLLRAALAAGDHPTAAESTLRLCQALPGNQISTLKNALEWIVDAGATEVVDRVLSSEEDNPLLQSQRALYAAAQAWRNHGAAEKAEELAERAFQTGPPEDAVLGRVGGRAIVSGRAVVGWQLRGEGHTDWARRELQQAIEQEGYVSSNGAFAAWELADILQDRQQYDQAAGVLDRMTDAITHDDRSRDKYDRLSDRQGQLYRSLDALRGSALQFRALAARQRGDSQQEASHLREAIERDPSNADIVIAMYRAGGPDDQIRDEARQHVRRLAAEFESQIDEDPQDALAYNQWAWLIANTEGDYDKAVRYSLRSLQRSPGNAGFLDTLGRCYYAAGDLDKAIEAQQKAVDAEPQFQVMQRQLELFKQQRERRDAQTP